MPSALIFYQYFYPDDVVSAFHLTQLAAGLAQRGWNVTAVPCNRSCRSNESYSKHSRHAGVSIRRIWRPSFSQSFGWGRLANCGWMIGAWSLLPLIAKPDLIIVGSDPVMSAIAAIPWKFLRARTRTVHWCFDLYPEAAVADGTLKPGFAVKTLKSIMRVAYKHLDLVADIGDCMRERLSCYSSPAKTTTIPPWALTEPEVPLPTDLLERKAVFGDSQLALLYSGNFGRAHSFAELLAIARQMRDVDAHFAFSIRGNRAEEVRKAVRPEDHNISFVPFAHQERLEARLSAADIQIVSLRTEWTGAVVPSKFFGALAAGRPVLFFGSEDSYVARAIRKHRVGWVCSPGSERAIVQELRGVAERPLALRELREHCHRVYHTYFARDLVLNRFDRELRSLLGESAFEAAPQSVAARGAGLPPIS